MIKLQSLLLEFSAMRGIQENEESINVDKLFYDEWYLDKIAKEMGYNIDFNSQFWNLPHIPFLYHCTEEDRWENIKTQGLTANLGSRGISNRNVGNAIFTTMEEEEVPFFKSYYGDFVIKIDAQSMKNDNFKPEVSREMDWDRSQKIAFIMKKMGKETEASQFVDSSDQNSSGTIIVYSNIPVKYLSISNL